MIAIDSSIVHWFNGSLGEVEKVAPSPGLLRLGSKRVLELLNG